MAEVTITGAADEMSSAVQSVAEAEKQRQQQAEEDARKAEKDYQEQQKEIAEEIEEEDTEKMADQQFDFAAAFDKLGQTLSAKLDELKIKPSEEEAKATRLAELKAELAALSPDDSEGEKTQQPATPPKKTTAKTQKPADGGEHDEKQEDTPSKGRWYSW